MRLLFLTHRLPYPPDKGERIRAYHELRFLGARHEVDLFCLADSASERGNSIRLADICRQIHVEVLNHRSRAFRAARNILQNKPASCGFFESESLAATVSRALSENDYDLIFVFCSAMAQFIPTNIRIPVAIDFVDADSQKWAQYARTVRGPLSWIYAREARTLAHLEAKLLRAADLAFAATYRDAKQLSELLGHDRQVHWIGNGVEVPGYVTSVETAIQQFEGEAFVIFVGTMDYLPNVEAVTYFADRILPVIRETYPKLKFMIVGRNPDRRVQQLGRRKDIIVTGLVPDVYQYLRLASVAVAPFTISQGFHNKIAEALAVGTPVVSTSTAAEGIGLGEQSGLFCADDPQAFAANVVRLLNDPSIKGSLEKRTGLVREELSWERTLTTLEKLLCRTAANRFRVTEPVGSAR